jgi:hypothetical protein
MINTDRLARRHERIIYRSKFIIRAKVSATNYLQVRELQPISIDYVTSPIRIPYTMLNKLMALSVPKISNMSQSFR